MNCKETKEYIQLYLDSELDARTTLDVQQHLEGCAGCTRLLEEFTQQDQCLRQAAHAETPDTHWLRQRVLQQIRQPLPPARPFWFRHPVLLRVAAVLLLMALGSWYFLREGEILNQKVYAAVAADHAAHCSVDNLMGAITNQAELDTLFAKYSALPGTPDLSSSGYQNPRARVCKVDEVEFLHVVYYHAAAPPISLFVRPHTPRLIAERMLAMKQEQYSISSVSKAGIDFMIVTSLNQEQTNALLQVASAQH